MNTSAHNASRRDFLRLSRGAAVTLASVGAVAALTGTTGYRWWQRQQRPQADGMQLLRHQDTLLFAALLPGVVGETANSMNAERIHATLQTLDGMLAASSPAMQKQIYDLVDLLTFKATQGLVSGYWGSWEQASHSDIEEFLQRWRNSNTELFRFGYAGICQLLLMAWYGQPSQWAAIGYPGPPAFLQRAAARNGATNQPQGTHTGART